MLAEGTIHQPVDQEVRGAVHAWFGPMVDSGFMQQGYFDAKNNRLLLIVSGETVHEVTTRLSHLPIVEDRAVTFEVFPVTALRFI
jgi:hypothetical protein